MRPNSTLRLLTTCLVSWSLVISCKSPTIADDDVPVVVVEGQPLGSNVARVLTALAELGRPLDERLTRQVTTAAKARDAKQIQALLDPHVLFVVAINPESKVKVRRGPAPAQLQQAGYTPVLVKVINETRASSRLLINSPQAGPVYAGALEFSVRDRQQQGELSENQNVLGATDRFLAVEMYTHAPLADRLSGLAVEYALALVYCHESGQREATIGFDLARGKDDPGLGGEVAVLFDVQPAVPVRLDIRDTDGAPGFARLLFRDSRGHVYPPQAKRLAPDFFFQPHIYRASGETVILPPGKFQVQYGRGPEYRVLATELTVPQARAGEPSPAVTLELALARWIDPRAHGYYSGDHHIHAAGCAHYTSPTEGVRPEDMFRQVKGEALNVGCVLTWGPCFQFQRQFFQPRPHDVSDADTILKYDLEISGFGSQALGHVCLLNLRDQVYPGSEGTDTKGWPSWTTPVMQWCKQQGGVTGYAHSASGLHIDPGAAAARHMAALDRDKNGSLSTAEAASGLLCEPFARTDKDANGQLTPDELTAAHDRAADELPNLAIPEMNGVGAMELPVSVALGACDFISAMDTPRIQEWNAWYHVLNCGFPLKVSGETDFPCMSSRQVGQGRVYVRLGQDEELTFENWCRGLAQGRSYVSDGYAHALEFTVNGIAPGSGDVQSSENDTVSVRALVAFSPETPLGVAFGTLRADPGRRLAGDTVLLHGPRRDDEMTGEERTVELIVNGQTVWSETVKADGQLHEISREVPIQKSSWIAVRQFPQLHTNPVNVIVGGRPIRASGSSARWCAEVIELLWKNRENSIALEERQAARAAFDRAGEIYRQIAAEAG